MKSLKLKHKFGPVVLSALLSAASFAQSGSGSFTGLIPGNLVVSRSVYAGDANTVIVGQPLPPVCPTTAACGKGKATDNGAFPSTTGSNNVWNNAKVDGSFGVTSPIFLDQITPSGTLLNTYAVPTNLLTTSFPSKSELGLNVSQDGTSLIFMGYIAPPNTVDASNSNTPGVYDPTNPVGTSYFRGVAQLANNGVIQVTPTNAYPGNNGRAAVLANGSYFMVGNSNNGSGTPANVINATGVQIATPGQPATTLPTQVGTFSITQVNDPATGKPYAADKLGKDNNFRGLTLFNNTLYVTKGSGGNGINTVYQVGTPGTLPTLATAAATPLTILPGFPTTLAKNADASNPFGLFFANATTLYVADEGDGTAANAATSKIAGLQKWILVNGTWKLAYVLQNGLGLGQQYSVAGYPTALNPATDGLRNISGKVNSDGTVTVWGITSTVSANGDQGADPNKLVAITDNLANTDPAIAANELFTTVRTAAAGEVLRGVSFAPTPGFFAPGYTAEILSAATAGTTTIAPNSLATANGQRLANGAPAAASLPLPTSLGGTSVTILDAAGNTFAAPLTYVSAGQVNFLVPSGVASGAAKIIIASGDGISTTGIAQIAPVAPGLFTLNNTGLAAANAIRVAADGTQTSQSVSTTSGTATVANPINLGTATDRAYLVLFGTGLQGAKTAGVTVTVNGLAVPVLYAGPQGAFAGLDQVNIALPASLAGAGSVNIQLTAAGIASNPVQVTIQ